jgi:enoyl-CoA hydratase/carnithine racemase
MGSLVTYEREGSVATVTMDDGKVNVMSHAMQKEIHTALDRAEEDRATVLLRWLRSRGPTGRRVRSVEDGQGWL